MVKNTWRETRHNTRVRVSLYRSPLLFLSRSLSLSLALFQTMPKAFTTHQGWYQHHESGRENERERERKERERERERVREKERRKSEREREREKE